VDVIGDRRRVFFRADRRLGERVEQTERLDRPRTGIRQQRERDVVPFGERGQDLRRIVTDRRQAETAPAKIVEAILQLDELRLAVRSPVRRSEEHQHRAFRAGD